MDDGQSWAQLIPRIPTRFQEFVKRCTQLCTKNVLAQVRVLAPTAPLSKIAEEADSQEYIDAVERMEPEVEDLASRIVIILILLSLLLMMRLDVFDLYARAL